MTTRRHVLMPLALAPVAGWAIWSSGSGEPTHPFSRFHLPVDELTALWRELSRVHIGHGAAPEFPANVRGLDGQPVRLRGYMVPLDEASRHRRFILAANPVGCPACERPSPATMVHVNIREPVPDTRDAIVLAGTLRLMPQEGLFYRLESADLAFA
ncbi:DUF3299 domain-containing protein [Azospirillum sp. A39]|uniref:DUF3299 domain-containing protein n=1 Tax=Azospirillum sp. A39 TaxID=3462279 RepID=UPI00404565FB